MADEYEADSFARALTLNHSSQLKHPDKEFLDSFLTEAMDPELASRYFLRRRFRKSCRSNALDQFVADWKVIAVACTLSISSAPKCSATDDVSIVLV